MIFPMGMILGMMVFFVLCLAIFAAVAIFLPEWLGITGNKAKEIMKEQTGDSHNDQNKS